MRAQKRFNVVVLRLVLTAMPLVFGRVSQQFIMKLPDAVFCQGDVPPALEYNFHHRGITGDFLFIAGFKRADLDAAQSIV